MPRYVAYFRVSTTKQGASGLGIEAQRAAIGAYLSGDLWECIGEFTEVESGRRADRPQLDKALALARVHRAPLVVSKVDRLTRSAHFLHQILASGVDIRFADLPQIEGATGRFLLQQMVAVAELEAGMISARTKAALAAAKIRGRVLGGRREREGGTAVSPSPETRKAALQATQERVSGRAADLAPMIAELQMRGASSLGAIARGLNANAIPTARGTGRWTAVQVRRVIDRIEAA